MTMLGLLALAVLAQTRAMTIELTNRTPLPLEVRSVDSSLHKPISTVCSLTTDSSCVVSADFIVLHTAGHEQGDFWDAWYGATWQSASGSYDITLDPAHPNYLQYKETAENSTCSGSVQVPKPFYVPSQGQPNDIIQHVPLPFKNNGFTINAGKQRGTLQFANTTWLRKLDRDAIPFSHGAVETKFGLPNSTTGGWKTRTTSLHENWNQGLSPDRFGVLLQKQSEADNVNIVKTLVDGKEQNVLRLTAKSVGDGTILSAATVATADLFASGRFEIKARFPAARGVVAAMWTYHYELHFEADHLPPGQSDPQFQQNVTGWASRVNHEIDIEIPASCQSLCGKDSLGCVGRLDTMNLNNYIVSNTDGLGPGFNNMCAQAPAGTDFIDADPNAQFHTYGFEWHSGSENCKPRVDFFFDGKYVATNDIFVPSRASRFTFGIWPGEYLLLVLRLLTCAQPPDGCVSGKWAGTSNWKGEVHADIAEVHICPFNEENDANYPQIYDQPFNFQERWQAKSLPPVVIGEPAATDICKGGQCSGSSDRAEGCGCHDDSKVCESGCCDYDSVPGVTTGKCAPLGVCEAHCRKQNARPFKCECSESSQCGTGCCSNGKCDLEAKCDLPCTNPVGRPDGCACGLVGECKSDCCDYKAVSGSTHGTCAQKAVCQQECEASASRPIGCACTAGMLCQSGCCSSSMCRADALCPKPSECSADTGKPTGCSCGHGYQCVSNWCAGVPAVCTPH